MWCSVVNAVVDAVKGFILQTVDDDNGGDGGNAACSSLMRAKEKASKYRSCRKGSDVHECA